MAPDAVIRARLHAALDGYMKTTVKPGAPGVLVALARRGRMIFLKGYGLASIARREPWSARTVHQIASVSKQFAAFCIFLLEKERKLKLNDDVRKYVPELPRYGRPIRIRHLIYHTSGLRSFDQLFAAAGRFPLGDDPSEVLEWMAAQRELQEPTGTAYRYCNTGYFLLARIVERVSGMPYHEFAARRIFRPLGMKHTFVRNRARIDTPLHSVGYSRGPNGRLLAHPGGGMGGRGCVGASEVQTTAPDLVKWADNFRHGRVGGPAILRAMHRPGRLGNGKIVDLSEGKKEATYAGGLCLAPINGWEFCSHGGGIPGYRSLLVRVRSNDLTFVLFMNEDTFNLGPLVDRVQSVVAIHPPYPDTPAFTPDHPVKPNRELEIMRLREADLRRYEGVYRPVKEKDDRWAVTAAGGRLQVTAQWGTIALAPIKRHGFIGVGQHSDSEFWFRMSPTGRPTGMYEVKGGKPLKDLVVVLLPEQVRGGLLRALSGAYDSAEIRSRFRLKPGRWWLTAVGPRLEPGLRQLWPGGTGHLRGRQSFRYYPGNRDGAAWFSEERSTMAFTRRRGRVTGLTWKRPRFGYGLTRLKLLRS